MDNMKCKCGKEIVGRSFIVMEGIKGSDTFKSTHYHPECFEKYVTGTKEIDYE